MATTVGDTSAVLKGDPEARQLIRQSFLGKLQEFVPGRS
jgi:hypothetical protein